MNLLIKGRGCSLAHGVANSYFVVLIVMPC